MKLTLKFIVLGVIALFASCSEPDPVIYTGDAATDQTLIQLTSQMFQYEVDQNGQGSLEIDVIASSKASEDRTIDVELVSDNIDAGQVVYNLDQSVTIPAGEYLGHFNLDVTSSNISEIKYKVTLKLAAPNNDKIALESNEATVIFVPYSNN